MNKETNRNGLDLNDDILDSSESASKMGAAKPVVKKNLKLSYGDVIIMIWRRIKMNEKMLGRIE